ncbi:hypothetical protein VFPPC_06740 [Pochonia chlamydosporia 170]|uniref:Secreted protein n=1 Tax=Pochonia chlamydosporia 170 TaxID=1380566 RepID=A0A179F5C5_METCM|nr:hypothetical protein VFPPC_06740 [Pochonia chlamydosporia 170]OAQ60627.1 hypothetical protein VFPPC_06740 [Pochonia chlamydosporia 170]
MVRVGSILFIFLVLYSISHVTKKTDMPHGTKRFGFFVHFDTFFSSIPPFFVAAGSITMSTEKSQTENWLVLFYLQTVKSTSSRKRHTHVLAGVLSARGWTLTPNVSEQDTRIFTS